MKVEAIEKHLHALLKVTDGVEGLEYGDYTADVKKIVVCWMATTDALRYALEQGANLVLAHEALFYPYPGIRGGLPPADHMAWPANRRRLELMAQGRLSVVRVHGALDRTRLRAAFADALELPPPVVDREYYIKIHELPPTPIRALVDHVKRCVGVDYARVTPCDPARVVRRVGLAFGGLGLFVNVSAQAELMKHSPEVLIGGESDAYGFIFAIEAGVVFIETGHEVSENIGLRPFAAELGRSLPGIPVLYYENPRPWNVW